MALKRKKNHKSAAGGTNCNTGAEVEGSKNKNMHLKF